MTTRSIVLGVVSVSLSITAVGMALSEGSAGPIYGFLLGVASLRLGDLADESHG